MAEIIQEEKGKKSGKRRPKKYSTRIDMTPMVDLMCLLITFFMLTTAFSKPKVMVITMPEKNQKKTDESQVKIPENRTVNIILSGKDQVFYFNGLADPKKPLPNLVQSNFSKDGIRKVLLGRNKDLFTRIVNYRDSVVTGKCKIFVYTDDSKKPVFAREGKKVFKSTDEGGLWTQIPAGNPPPADDLAMAQIILQNAERPELNIVIDKEKKKIIKREVLLSEVASIVDAATKSMKREDKKGPIVLIKADEKAKYKDVVNIIDEMAICSIASYAIVDISPVELQMLGNVKKK